MSNFKRRLDECIKLNKGGEIIALVNIEFDCVVYLEGDEIPSWTLLGDYTLKENLSKEVFIDVVLKYGSHYRIDSIYPVD